MPNINDINGVTVANLAKLDAVLKANISKVNGLTLSAAAAFTGLLDETYGTDAEFAFSVRRLSSTTTVLMRVRRDTNTGGAEDDDEADVGYDANNDLSLDSPISNASAGVTATTLGEFINVGTVGGTTYSNPDSLTVTASCWVDSWYDQTGNGNHAEQSSFTVQPRLHDGTVNTDLIQINGKPALQTNTSTLTNQQLQIAVVGATIAKPWTVTGVAEGDLNNPFWSTNRRVFQTTGNLRLSATGQITVTMDASPQCMYLAMCTTTGTNSVISGSTSTTQTSATATVSNASTLPYDAFNIGNRPSFDQGGHQQELIAWAADETGNKTSIESNVNSNYLIYQPTDAPTSGLLSTYTGAAAAYSVRQLSDKAILAVRIRRDSDDEERNIGWDANGDLDTTAISDFCQTANGYVTRWWDQSTNGNHADQATDTRQPQIYNGTAVITENGKPAVEADDTPQSLGFTSTAVGSAFMVYRKTANKVLSTLIGGSSAQQIDGGGTFAAFGKAINVYDGSTALVGTTAADNTNQYLGSVHLDTSDSVRVNGSQENTGTIGSVSVARIFQREDLVGDNRYVFVGRIQEVIIYASAQSGTDIAGIETDINTYFSIYT